MNAAENPLLIELINKVDSLHDRLDQLQGSPSMLVSANDAAAALRLSSGKALIAYWINGRNQSGVAIFRAGIEYHDSGRRTHRYQFDVQKCRDRIDWFKRLSDREREALRCK